MKTEDELNSLALIELSDLCTELWFNFGTAQPKEKKAIREEYNQVAEYYNKRAGWKCMSYITDQTKVTPPMEERIEKNQRPWPEPKGRGGATEALIKKKKRSLLAPGALRPEEGFGQTKTKQGGSIIQQILALHKEGKTNAEIIAAGFNKSTVSRQVSEYKKSLLK